MTIIGNIIGLLIIAFIVYWFWLCKPQLISKIDGIINITVKDGVYQPAYIQAQLHKPITLRFIREDTSACAEVVMFSSLNISKALPLHQPVDIQLTLEKPGEYEFTCQMGMYRGKIFVKP